MAFVLLTGMTASQASRTSNERALSYAAQIHRGLVMRGHTVNWTDPDIHWTAHDLSQYDAIVLGLAPVTSLAANRTYGALSILEHMYGSSKLTMFIDAPMPAQIADSIRSVTANPGSLIKPFFSYRKHFAEANKPQVLQRLRTAVEILMQESWPTTLYPVLPWPQTEIVWRAPDGADGALSPLNLDRVTPVLRADDSVSRGRFWAADAPTSTWTKYVRPTLSYTVAPMRMKKNSTDAEVLELMREALGVLVSPQKIGGTWWTNAYLQAMSTGTPIATEWRDAGVLDESWNLLASQIEHIGADERFDLSNTQRETYFNALPSRESQLDTLEATIGLATTVKGKK